MRVKKILSMVLCLCTALSLLVAMAITSGATAQSVETMTYTGSFSQWKDIAGEFKAISVTAKNYLPMAQSAEKSGKCGYSIVLRITMDNGKFYAFRIINDTAVRYAYSRFGADGAATGWDGRTWVDSKDSAATGLINGNGAAFKVERTAANVLTVSINGTVLDTYTMEGVTSSNKVVSVGLKHYGNPASSSYVVKVPVVATYARSLVKVSIASASNGKVTADKTSYRVGDTVTLKVTPNSGYAYKTLKLNGKSVSPNTSGVYSFVAQQTTNEVAATFTKAVFAESTTDKWNLVHQGAGKLVMSSHASGDSGWLKPLSNVSDITTTVRDYYPTAKNFSMIYKFTFSNGEILSLRLNGTDSDGKYRIQTMNGSTLAEAWKSYYTLTDAQITKVKNSGIKFRVAIEGSNAVVYLDGTQACSIDLSKIVATGKASYIKNMPVSLELRMDGNLNKSVTIPFQMTNSIKPITITIPTVSNGKVTASKTSCEGGETIKLTVTPNSGYAYKTLKLNGTSVSPNTSGVYSFVAQESTNEVTATFTKAVFAESTTDKWNLVHQGAGKLVMSSHASGDSGWLKPLNNVSDITTTVRDYYPTAKNFSMIYKFTFSNGEILSLRLNGTDSDGKYRIQTMNGSTLAEAWKSYYTLTDAQITKVKNSGIKFRVAIEGSNAVVYLDGTQACSIDLSKIVATGKASYIKNMPVSLELRMDGNLNKSVTIPFQMTNSIKPITITIPTVSNGKVTASKTSCEGGETIKLTVTPNSGYAYKTLKLNGTSVSPDTSGVYSFVAQESTNEVTATFTKAVFAESTTDKWNLVHQGAGKLVMSSHASGDSGWLKPLNNVSDITTTVRDYYPTAKNFSMIYKFTFSNGEILSLRLNGTDSDGKYRIQTMNGSTLAEAWKSYYTLTDAQITKVKNSGIKFRVAIEGSNAVVYLDGTQACSIDLSKIVATGKASYIKNMPVSLELRMDGNLNKSVTIPFQMTNSIKPITITIPAASNGKVTASKTSCEGGETIKLTVTPNSGYAYKTLKLNGTSVSPDTSGVYSFVAQESTNEVTATFTKAVFAESTTDKWNLVHQGAGKLVMSSHASGDSGWLKTLNDTDDVTTTVRDYYPTAKNFSMIYKFTFSNGEILSLRLNGTDSDGKYRIQIMDGSTLAKAWKNYYTLTDAQITKVKNSGIKFRVAIEGANAVVYLDGTKVCSIDLSKVVATGKASYIRNKSARVELRMDGNLNKSVTIAYTLANDVSWTGYQFKTAELDQYVIVYDADNADYATYAKQLANQISAKYGKTLTVAPDTAAAVSNCEILLGDTNRSDSLGRIMEYSVTVTNGKFRINVGGSCSAEKAIAYLCNSVFTGQALTLSNGEYYKTSLLTSSSAVTSGTTARIMTANVLADAFAGGSYKNANYRAEIFAGALVAYKPDALGLQETDANWNKVLDTYLTKIQKVYGITYSRCMTTYEGKINYTSLLYRSDKFKVENSGIKVFSWWKDLGANYGYHMRNITWAQFASLDNSGKKFVLANTHWSYRTEHADGKTYLKGSGTAIAVNELRMQCVNETKAYMAELKKTYSTMPIFLTGDFNTSLPFFTQSGWTPTSYNVISEQAKNNGTAKSTVPTSGHFDHIFGTGSYTIKRYEFFKNVNQHSVLTDHPFAYVDVAF